MVTTGLLSLSVHEALTFEGTEIALHPDLFSGGPNSGAGAGGGGGTGSLVGGSMTGGVVGHSGPVVVPPLSVGVVPSSSASVVSTIQTSGQAGVGGRGLNAASTAALGPQRGSQHHRVLSTTSTGGFFQSIHMPILQPSGGDLTFGEELSNNRIGSPGGSIVSGNASTLAGQHIPSVHMHGASKRTHRTCLEVGDMIEIRVWDAKSGPASSRHQHDAAPLASRRARHTRHYSEISAVPSVLSKQMTASVVTAAASTEQNTPSGGTSTFTSAEASPVQPQEEQSSPKSGSSTSLQYSLDSGTTFQTPFSSISKLNKPREKTATEPRLASGTEDQKRKGSGKTSKTQKASKDASSAPHESHSKVIIVPSAPGSSPKPVNTSKSVVTPADVPRDLPPPPLLGRAETIPPPARIVAGVGMGSKLPQPISRNKTLTTGAITAGAEASELPLRERNRASSPAPLPNREKGVIAPPIVGRPSILHTRDVSDLTAVTLTPIPTTGRFVSGNLIGATSLTTPSMSPDEGDEANTESEEEDPIAKISKTHNMRISFVMVVNEKTLTSIKGTARTQISLLRQIADLYNLSSFDMVTVTKIEKADEAAVLDEISADFVTVIIKDQFISRGEMLSFQESLFGRWIYEGERLDQATKDGVRALAKEIRHGEREAKSGIVTSDTKITFRSRSARFIWLVQLSSEMWEYASPYEAEGSGFGTPGEDESACEIYFDKFISFLHRLFEKWKELDVTHSLTVVFFSRTYHRSHPGSTSGVSPADRSAFNIDVDGRVYRDHFKPVIENETRADWDSLVLRIKKEFVKYPLEVGWNLSSEPVGFPSTAAQGNVLEAINVTLNLLQYHYMDRDLHRTGNSIVIVSAGCGVFEVDKGLAGITKQRMMDNGIGSDMLSLGLPPLHIGPFFLYKETSSAHVEETHGFDDWKTYFEIPHWMHLSFVSYDQDQGGPRKGRMRFDMTSYVVPSKRTIHQEHHIYVAANGFLIRGGGTDMFGLGGVQAASGQPVVAVSLPKLPSGSSLPSLPGSKIASTSERQQRDLISEREFEDILEACRPRDRGETIKGLPSSLASLLRMWAHTKTRSIHGSKFENSEKLKEASGSVDETLPKTRKEDSNLSDDTDDATPVLRPSRPQETLVLKEWGSVEFESMDGKTRPAKVASCHTLVDFVNPLLGAHDHSEMHDSNESDKSSPSSSFASNYSFLLARSCDRGGTGFSLHNSPRFTGIQMQPSLSLDIPFSSPESGGDGTDMAHARSGDSLSTMGGDDYDRITEKRHGPEKEVKPHTLSACPTATTSSNKKNISVEALRDRMSKYDNSLFYPLPKPEKQSKIDIGPIGAPITSVVVPGSQDMPPGKRAATPAHSWRGTGTQSPLDITTHSVPSLISPSTSGSNQVGGIGAALAQHDSGNAKRILSARRMKALDGAYTPVSNSSGGANSYSHLYERGIRPVSPSVSSLGMPLSSDPPERLHVPHNFSSSSASTLPYPGVSLAENKQTPNFDNSIWGQHVPRGGSVSVDVPSRAGPSHHHYPPTGKNQMGPVLERSAKEFPIVDSRLDLGTSPPKPGIDSPSKKTRHHSHSHAYKGKTKKKHNRHVHHGSSSQVTASRHTHRRKPWVLNPFRQQDEEEVLAKRTHNRRRWSHVFLPGEIEFKRHSGPLWKSLCQPAILPLTTDFHPSPQELNDPAKFQFNFYDVSIRAMDRSSYTSHSDLLMEMVRQRLVQDYQIVPKSVIKESTRRGEAERQAQKNAQISKPQNSDRGSLLMNRKQPFPLTTAQSRLSSSQYSDGKIQHTLSMGHRIQVLTYNPSVDTIEVIQYHARFAQNDPSNIQRYRYMLWSSLKKTYAKCVQTFTKYSEVYRWNKFDNMICGDPEKTMEIETRYRRVMFSIIPDPYTEPSKEQEYVSKFHRLCGYLSKLQQKDLSKNIDIKIITGESASDKGAGSNLDNSKEATSPMLRFIVQLRKGKNDKYEWMEIVLDSTFNTCRTFRIRINWLVASASKVEAQIQLLHRRCSQYGLRLVEFPQLSTSSNVFLHPFIASTMIAVRDRQKATCVEAALVDRFKFVDDGIHSMEPQHIDDIDDIVDFEFPVGRRGRKKTIPVQQYVHHSGTLFVRLIRDDKGKVLFISFENRLRIGRDENLRLIACRTFTDLCRYISDVVM